jgi:beta-galactosidase GanA
MVIRSNMQPVDHSYGIVDICRISEDADHGYETRDSSWRETEFSLAEAGTATQLIVDGKPFLALAGELGNNSATSLEYMKPVWPKLVEAKLNTVLAGVSWAQIEPQEGKFDFSVLDGVIRERAEHNLRLVLLWFGSWKNGLSSYAPDWVKKDFERFPRAQVARRAGKSIELLSPFSDANRDADARAFAALMRHVKAVDGRSTRSS